MWLSAWIILACWLTVSVRGIEHLRASSGTFHSPNYPNQYANDLSKVWEISVRLGYHIKLRFTHFHLEESYEEDQGWCVYDFVTITEGTVVIGKYCGNSYLHQTSAPKMYEWIYTKSNTVRIHFESDYSNENIAPTGFSVDYAEIDIDECARQRHKEYTVTEDWDELVTCNHFCTNTQGSYFCSCRRGFQLHENGHTCFAKFCENQVLTGLQGDIKSPDYPLSYAKLSNCVWDIEVPAGFSINVIFSRDFDIEEHIEEGCVYDIFNMRYKTSTDRFCGRTAPRNGSIWDLNTNTARIEFSTDLSVEKMGFKLHYNTTRIKCLKHPRAPVHGSIPPNAKGFYEFEDSVRFSCNRGYDLIGEPVISCLSNGEWDFEDPTCRIKSCGRPTNLIAVRHSSIENLASKAFTYLEKVTVVCDEWYEQRSGYATWRCEDSKLWTIDSGQVAGGSTNIPTCRPICGKRLVDDDQTSVQVSGGKKVKKDGGWPWMAFIDLGGSRSGETYCGGALIDEETVVTAAHCLDNVDPSTNIEVWLGLRNRKTDNYNFTQSFTITPDRRHIYEGFNTLQTGMHKYFDGDIAILELGQAATLSYYVRPVCVPYGGRAEGLISDYQRSGKNAIVTGWGKTPGDLFSDVLMKVRLGIVDSRTCQANYQEEFGDAITITANMICAGYEYGPSRTIISDTCQQDSGGPLVTKLGSAGSETWYISGIVSFGDERNRCGGGRTYGVYAKVSNFENFINRYTVQIV